MRSRGGSSEFDATVRGTPGSGSPRRFAAPSRAVLNLDGDFGVTAAREPRGPYRVIGYRFEQEPGRVPRWVRPARVIGRSLEVHANGPSFDVVIPWGDATVKRTLIGCFNDAAAARSALRELAP